MKYVFDHSSIYISLLGLFLAGCRVAHETPEMRAVETVPTPIVAITNTFIPIETTRATATENLQPTQTSTSVMPVELIIPSPTNTSIPTSTWTPAPTLSRQEADALVKDLLENNGGCRLPCWWGMMPGITEWNQARHFLETFVTHIGQGGEGYEEKEGRLVYSTNYGIGYERENGGSGFTVGVIDGIISGIETGWDRSQDNYYLGRLLADYGIPEEVIFEVHTVTSAGGPPPFYFLVSYKGQGFFAEFMLKGVIKGDRISGCPQRINPALYLFPGWEWTREEMIEAAFGPPFPGREPYPTYSIEEATGMDRETFYEVFKEPDNQECLESPVDLWP